MTFATTCVIMQQNDATDTKQETSSKPTYLHNVRIFS